MGIPDLAMLTAMTCGNAGIGREAGRRAAKAAGSDTWLTR